MTEPMTYEQYAKDYPGNHFLVLGPTNPVRKIAFKISTSKLFDSFILLAIVVNCIMMAMSAPLPLNDTNELNNSIEALEVYLLAIFIGEACVKMLTQGFILHAGSYIRNGWNLLDFTVVVTGILGLPSVGMGENAGPMKVIKAARVLRPLKLVSGVPSLQIVMSAIIKSMASLLQISLLIGFVIVIFAIIFLSFLPGKFHYTCFKNATEPFPQEYQIEAGRLCSEGSSGRPCPEGSICKRYWDGPNFGVTNFDNIFSACLTVFTCITCEGWTDTMYWTMDVMDYDGYYMFSIYWLLNVIGAQFMLNLVCGVLSGEFSKEKERVESRNEFLRQRREDEARERAIANGEEWIDEGERLRLEEEARKLAESQKEEPIEGVDPPPQLSAFQAFVVKNNAFRVKLKSFMLSKFMFWFIVSAVFLNSLFGAIQHYRQPQWITDVTSITDNLFLGIFVSEMCLKLYAVGPNAYFQSKFNKFDFSVVVMGLINLFLSKMFNINLGIPVLRQLRLMRLFKFTKYYKKMKNLVQSIINSMAAIVSLLVLLFLFLMIFALLGMNIFGGQFYAREHIGKPFSRTNFDDFFNAMLAVFQIITGEDWNFVMYEGIVAYGGPRSPVGLAVSLYFVGVTVLGNYVLLNVFLAIAVDNISLDDDEEKAEEEAEEERADAQQAVKDKYAPPSARSNGEIETASQDRFAEADRQVIGEYGSTAPPGHHAPGDNFLENLKDPSRMTGNIPTFVNAEEQTVNTLFIFPPDGIVRRIIHPIVTSPHFDNFILALILISSALLALENPTNPDADINKILNLTDYFFTTVFALEVLLKVVNFGFALHPNSYCRDAWNCADMFVVSCAITSLVLSQDKNASTTVKSIVKILRILRVLRPLKSINKLQELKAVFQCMVFSLQNVVNVLIITVQFLLIFSMMGVQLFNGKLFQCNDPSKEFEDECQGYYITFDKENYNRPIQVKREWSLIDWNFNHLGIALTTLFSSATGEGWPAVMQTGIDSQLENQGPLLNNKIWIAIYFIVFVVIFSFFFINVFVGLIILTFQNLQIDPNAALDRNTKNSFDFVMRSKPMERFMPEDVKSWQYKAWALVESSQWEILISVLIALNTVVLMMEFADQPDWYSNILGMIGDVFTFVFTFEFALKMFALGCNYFKDFWNNFDMFIVLGSILDFMIKKILPPGTVPFDTSSLRLFRALRLIKLLRRFRDLRILLWTFLQSFKALPYVCMLIFLLFFVYGIIGMQIFSSIDKDSEDDPWNQINRNNHFSTYFSSTQVLFRVATGENWPNIMLACTSGAKCDQKLRSVQIDNMQDCGSPIAYVYFISFVFFCSFLMLNLFIAVIMDNFAFLTEDSSILGPHHLDEFVTVWSDFDPRASGRIQHTEVCELLRQMLPPVGLGLKCPKTVAYKRLVQMNMRYYRDGTVDYTGTFFALVRTGLKVATQDANLKKTDQEFKNMLKKQIKVPKRTLDMIIPRVPRNAKHMTIAKIYTAKLIWENYKNMKKAQQPERRKSIFVPSAEPPKPVANGKAPLSNGHANGSVPNGGVTLKQADEEWC